MHKIMEPKDNQYALLSEAVDDLIAKGYSDELKLGDNGLYNGPEPLDPTLFTIDSFHRLRVPVTQVI